MIDSSSCIPIRKVETEWAREHSGMGTAWGTFVIYLASLWFSISVAHALSTDSEQPIHIEADWAEASEAHKTVIYKGAVVIIQGSMRINGEKVTLYYNEDHTLAKAEVEGRPARFQQRPDGNVEKQHAKANLMKYYADRDLILLLGNAHSWQGKRRVSAERIEFDTKESRVKAHGNLTRESKDRTTGKSGKSRVRIVVPAKKKN